MSSATANQPFVFSSAAHRSASSGGGDVVGETRREIAEIVREVATAARSDASNAEFLTLLCDRTLRAMAAEGIVVWMLDPPGLGPMAEDLRYQCVHRLGRVTDQSIDAQSNETHQRMLIEVGSGGSPVVVPPTPGATAAEVPANPTDVPAAIVPVPCEGSRAGAEYLIEVFLEPGGGIGTQRGYLRFVAQMADLAGEFFRADQLRRLRRNQRLASKVDEAAAAMHRMSDPADLIGFIVDNAADIFDFDRVGLTRLGPSAKTKLVGVSHVATIDQRSSAAHQIRDTDTIGLGSTGCRWFDPNDESQETQNELYVRVVAGCVEPPNVSYRLVGLRRTDAEVLNRPHEDEEGSEQLIRFATHASLALKNLEKPSGAPRRLLRRLFPTSEAASQSKSIFAAVIGCGVVLAGLIPIPLVVDAPAVVRAENAQRVCAERDAIVKSVRVTHGESVGQGQVLLTLSDPLLEEQISTLWGRRAVLLQQQSLLTESIVGSSPGDFDLSEKSQNERSLVVHEIQSIDEQLAILNRIEQSLTIRADREGIVDAWRVESDLDGRPVARGDTLMRVIAMDCQWSVEAKIPQNRVSYLQDRIDANVSLDSVPNRVLDAKLVRLGPAVISEEGGIPATAALLKLTKAGDRAIRSDGQSRSLSGAPARVVFRCGSRPAVYVLFQDLIRSLRSTASLYLANSFNYFSIEGRGWR